MCHSIPSVQGKPGVWIDWIKWVSQVALVPMIGLSLWAFWEHEERLDELQLGQQSRFTAEDGVALAQIVLLIEERLAAHMMQTIPSGELVKTVDYQREYLDHDRRIGKLESER